MILPAIVRRGMGVLLSVGVNLGLIYSLARLDAPPEEEDRHEAHQTAPQVVEPPPPPPRAVETAKAAPPAASALPEAPPLPDLALPDGPSLEGGLALGGLTGLGGLGLGAISSAPIPRSVGSDEPDTAPLLSLPPDLTRYYPPEARRRGLEGRSLVELSVDASGAVSSARVLRSDPPGIFDAAALKAARGLRFEPAQLRGRPVPGRTRLDLEWRTRN